MKHLFTLTFILICTISFSQKDTLFLYKNCYVLGGKVYNKMIDGIKQGKWIEYNLNIEKVKDLYIINWSGIDSLGNDVHGSYSMSKKYEPKSNFDGTSMDISPDTLFHNDNLTLVYSWIAPKIYFISSIGKYKDGKKEEKWVSYYQNNQIKKKIIFRKGIPIRDFEVFREDGSVMFSVSVLENGTFEICKHQEKNKEIECSIKSIEEIDILIH